MEDVLESVTATDGAKSFRLMLSYSTMGYGLPLLSSKGDTPDQGRRHRAGGLSMGIVAENGGSEQER
jgi:hypothetical protein